MFGLEFIKKANEAAYRADLARRSADFINSGWKEGVARCLLDLPKTGGFTFRPGVVPPIYRYMVGGKVQPSPIIQHPHDIVKKGLLFFRQNVTRLQNNSSLFAGGWKEEKTGFFHLDISEWIPELYLALKLGKERKQLTIWSLANGREIKIS